MNRLPFLSLLLAAAFYGNAAMPLQAVESVWVKTGVTNRLIHVPDHEGDRIPNFSMAGYAEGQRPIPTDVPVVIHIDPLAGDNTQHIQSAINFASSQPMQANGFRGIVELGPGKFNVDGHLSITASGVVLRGSGGGDDLAGNTHIVSQNRTDSIASASTPIISIQGSSSGITRGPQIQIVDKRVPVGAQSFRVASTAGMTVGGMLEVFRPSTQAWIEELGMHLIPDGKEWAAGDRDLAWQRTITRIEGNRVFLDAPITTALDQQWGGGTVRTYSAPNVIRNVGVENLRGQSLDNREESNEDRTPTFVRFSRVDDGWVRDVETRHFTYASVYALQADGTQHITVDNVTSLLPAGLVTGGRRYSFAMDAQMSLVQNSHADSGRHDFVTGSDVTGPIVFHNSTTSNTRGDAGPHHRWGNGLLFDNIDVNGNAINVQNRWTSGSGHGWAGANVVIWNSEANSFIAQSPPTAQSWLVGSTGTINAGNCHLGAATCAGYYDSHGTRVTTGGTESLYEAQVNDAADIREFHWDGSGNWSDSQGWDQRVTPGVYKVSQRDYLWGDIDDYTLDPGRTNDDNAYIDPGWQATIASESSETIYGFDRDDVGDHNSAFTIFHQLDSGERVVHGSLAMSLKRTGTTATDDFLQLFDSQPQHRLSFASLGWSNQINATNSFVGVIDVGQYLDQLQSASINTWVSNSTSVDWAMYTIAVATPKADAVGPNVYLDGGKIVVDSPMSPIGNLQNGNDDGTSHLEVTDTGRITINQDFVQHPDSSLSIQVGSQTPGQFGMLSVGNQAVLAGAVTLARVGSYLPAPGTEFEILTAGVGVIGQFDSSIMGDPSGTGVWGIVYHVDSVAAQFLSDTPFGDLDGNSLINPEDWNQYLAWALMDLSGLPLAEAYQRGDLNGDGINNLDDMRLFIGAYNMANGVGAFERMIAGVPEPLSGVMLAIGAAFAACGRIHRKRLQRLR